MTDGSVSLGEVMAERLGEIKIRFQDTECCPSGLLCECLRKKKKEKKKWRERSSDEIPTRGLQGCQQSQVGGLP